MINHTNFLFFRFVPELTDASNTGLHTALLEMEVVKLKFPWISYGDLWTLAGVTALEEMGCHPIKWRPGRIDCIDDSTVPPNGRLPLGYLGSDHIREVFLERLGFDEREAVLLIGGGHSLGRCHSKYSGWEGKWTENPIHFSNRFFTALLDEHWKLYKVPTTENVQYVNQSEELMMLNTDMELGRDQIFKKWSKYYAEDNDRFLKDFAEVFAKLIELGVPRGD